MSESPAYDVEYRPQTKLWVVVERISRRVIAVKDTERAARLAAAKEGKPTGRRTGWGALNAASKERRLGGKDESGSGKSGTPDG